MVSAFAANAIANPDEQHIRRPSAVDCADFYSMSLKRNFTPPVPSCSASRAYAWPSGVATAALAAV